MLCYISTTQELTWLIENQKNFVVYKYNSNSCKLSEKTIQQIQEAQAEWQLEHLYFVDIIEHRDVSNLIEEVSLIKHESPQVIVFKEWKASTNTSHMKINKQRILDNYPL